MKHYLLSAFIISSVVSIISVPLGVNAAAWPGVDKDRLENPVTARTDIALVETWFFESGQDGAEMGFSVSGAGDVNGDGYADIIVGSPRFDSTDNGGAAFAFYGYGGGLKSTPDWQVNSGKDGARFGLSVSAAGDVNADGYDDVLVGAPDYWVAFEGTSGDPQSGAAFLYLGSETGLSQAPDWVFYAEAREISLGYAVAAAGDVNHDGYADILVGAPEYENIQEQANEGKVYLFLGSENGPGKTPDWTYQGDSVGAKCGHALAAAGDVDGDHYDDILIGAPNIDSPELNEGAALLFLGSPDGPGEVADWQVESNQADAWFGEAVASAGDVNRDGFSDVIVGSAHYNLDEDHIDTGAAFVYLGSDQGLSTTAAWIAYGAEQYSGFGHTVSAAGDVDQDGFSDLLVGAYKYGQTGAGTQPDEGAAYIFTGGALGPSPEAGWSAFGNKAEAWFGFSARVAGDINGDGSPDILIGAPQYRFDEKTVMGRAYLYLNNVSGEINTNHQVFIPIMFSPK